MHRIIARSIACLPLILIFACSSTSTVAPLSESQSNATTGPVSIVVNDGESKVQCEVNNVAAGTTVEQVMRQVDDPRIKIKISGSGTTAIITAINDLTNSGGEGWIYRVDGKWADRGMGTFKLTPPVTITWQHGDFAEMQP